MNAIALALATTTLLATPTSSADEVDEAPSPWAVGAAFVAVADRHGAGIGGSLVARYHFVQAGCLGFIGTGDRGGFGTLGVVATFGKVDLGIEGLIGSHTVDTSERAWFGGCETEGPSVSAASAGAMFTVSRALRAGGAWVGGGVWFAQPIRTTRYTTTTTCTRWMLFEENQSTTTTYEETLGRTMGLVFRIGGDAML